MVSSTPRHERDSNSQLTACTGSYKSNYHTTMTTTTLIIESPCTLRANCIITLSSKGNESAKFHYNGNLDWNSFSILLRIRVMVFNATFNNISVISWWSVLSVEEAGVSGENHRPVSSHHSIKSITKLHIFKQKGGVI